MISFQVLLLTLSASLISANALGSTTAAPRRLVFPKVGEAVNLPTAAVAAQESRLRGVKGAAAVPVAVAAAAQPVRRYAVHEDAVPAAYNYHGPSAYHHEGGGDDEKDYHAHPQYAFKYSVNDDHTGDVKKAWEHRDGDVTHGGYSLVDPDGHVRTVEYTVTKHGGFQATVKRDHY